METPQNELPETEKMTINIFEPEPRAIPREFLAWLSEYGFHTLKKYLSNSGAPAEMVELAQGLETMAFLQENDTANNTDELLGNAVRRLAGALHYGGESLNGVDSVFKA